MAAATRLFARRGFEGTSIQAIADQVGIAKQSLLYHYPSKEALRRAVLQDLFEHWRRTLPGVLEAATEGRGRFDAITEELVGFFRTDPNRALILGRELLDNPKGIKRLIAENLRPWLLLVSEYIKRGQRAGRVHADVDPEFYVLFVIVLVTAGVANASVLASAFWPENLPKEELEKRHAAELVRFTRAALFVP